MFRIILEKGDTLTLIGRAEEQEQAFEMYRTAVQAKADGEVMLLEVQISNAQTTTFGIS